MHDYVLTAFENCYTFIRSIEEYKESLQGIQDSTSMGEITQLLFDDICPYIAYFQSIEDCEQFLGGLTQQGLVPLIANYLMNARIAMKEYEINKIAEGADYDYFNDINLRQCSKSHHHS